MSEFKKFFDKYAEADKNGKPKYPKIMAVYERLVSRKVKFFSETKPDVQSLLKKAAKNDDPRITNFLYGRLRNYPNYKPKFDQIKEYVNWNVFLDNYFSLTYDTPEFFRNYDRSLKSFIVAAKAVSEMDIAPSNRKDLFRSIVKYMRGDAYGGAAVEAFVEILKRAHIEGSGADFAKDIPERFDKTIFSKKLDYRKKIAELKEVKKLIVDDNLPGYHSQPTSAEEVNGLFRSIPELRQVKDDRISVDGSDYLVRTFPMLKPRRYSGNRRKHRDDDFARSHEISQLTGYVKNTHGGKAPRLLLKFNSQEKPFMTGYYHPFLYDPKSHQYISCSMPCSKQRKGTKKLVKAICNYEIHRRGKDAGQEKSIRFLEKNIKSCNSFTMTKRRRSPSPKRTRSPSPGQKRRRRFSKKKRRSTKAIGRRRRSKKRKSRKKKRKSRKKRRFLWW